MRQANSHVDSEDMFSDTRMSFGDHIEELRMYLWRAIFGFLIAMILCFFISKPVLSIFIIRPVEDQLREFYREQRKKRSDEVFSNLKKYQEDEGNKPKILHVQFSRIQLEDLL